MRPATRLRALLLLPLVLVPLACVSAACVSGTDARLAPRRVEPDASTPFDDVLPPEPQKVAHPPQPWPFDVLHYDIDIALDFERRSLSGTVRVRVRDLEDGVAALPLDAAEMTITDVRTDGGVTTWRHADEALSITLPDGSRAGTERVFEIDWTCTPARGVHFLDAPPGAPEWGRQAWTQGECEDSRYWLPCHDAPDDRATHAIAVTVPDGMTVTAAGARLGVDDLPGPDSTWRFAIDVPHVAYLTTFVAGDLEIVDRPGVVPLEYVANARDVEHVAMSLRRTEGIVRWLSEWTGRDYPYPRYAQCCVRDFIFGGMENISATTLTDTTVHPPEWEPVKSSDGLVAHEAAHQWFGDLITCKHWSEIWLNEGFATYLTLLWKEHDAGRDAFLASMRGTMNGALGACERARRPVVSNVYARPFDLFFDGHAYGGGAARLHALRHRLGDATFRRAIRLYVERNAGRCVTTDDLAAAVSEVADEDLTWWFDQWLRTPGRPKLRVSWDWDDAAHELVVSVAQTQKEPQFPKVYRLLLDVACDLRGGETVTERLVIEAREQTFRVPLATRPRLVRLDPGRGLLARLDVQRPATEWARLAQLDPSPAGRLDAVAALGGIARDGKRTQEDRGVARQALLRVRSDGRVEVRREVVSELKRLRNDAARDALVATARDDNDPRVRQAAVDALVDWTGDAAAEAAVVAAADGDASVHVRAAALRGLAKRNAPSAWERLVAALESTTWQSYLRGAALGGLADLGDERAFPLLVEAAAVGADPWTRDEALGALGRMGRSRPEYTEAVLIHLDDPRSALREAAASALAALEDVAAVPALVAAFREERFPRTQQRLRRAIVACRKAAALAGQPVTIGAARAIALRAEHARSRALATPEAKQETARLERELDALGVPPLPKPKPPPKPDPTPPKKR